MNFDAIHSKKEKEKQCYMHNLIQQLNKKSKSNHVL